MERQYVAIDLHKNRSLIVRDNTAGEELAVVRIDNVWVPKTSSAALMQLVRTRGGDHRAGPIFAAALHPEARSAAAPATW